MLTRTADPALRAPGGDRGSLSTKRRYRVRRGEDEEADLPPSEEREREMAERLGGAQRILCAACEHVLAPAAARISVRGSHIHERTNPHGFRFRFGCFDRAPGASVIGEPELAHTWFSGFPWQLALCGACGVHLGWRWANDTSRFFGLILDRIRLRDSPSA